MQAYLPTDGVTFKAVKEQLLLLGHDIPDHVIRSFLKDGSTKATGNTYDQGLSEGGEEHDGVSFPSFDDVSLYESNARVNAQSMGISVESQSWAAGSSIDHWDAAPASEPDVFHSPGTSYQSGLVASQQSVSHSGAVFKKSGQPGASCVTSDNLQRNGAAASDSGQDRAGTQQGEDQTRMDDHQRSSVQAACSLMTEDLEELNLVEVGACFP